MFVPFDTLPSSAKIWIYQANRLMTSKESEQLLNAATEFVGNWTAHQANLKGSVTVLYNSFVIFSVDESHNDVSGCSIDTKVHFMKNMEKKLGIDFFNRMNVAVEVKGLQVTIMPLNDLNKYIMSNEVSAGMLVFNNLVSTMRDFRKLWKVPLKDSWVINFLDKETVQKFY